jgi:hypothetical protein
MTDYTDLIARLRSGQFTEFQRTKNTEDITYPSSAGKMAADALEAQARRIAELESKVTWEATANLATAKLNANLLARIEALEAALKEALDYIDDPYNDLAIQIGELLNRAARAAYRGETK